MTIPEVLASIGTAYVVLTYLGSKLFPRAELVSAGDPRLTQRPSCQHSKRFPYTPAFSTGDESDYESYCISCRTVLREPPNVF
jgi:hypothetical protein